MAETVDYSAHCWACVCLKDELKIPSTFFTTLSGETFITKAFKCVIFVVRHAGTSILTGRRRTGRL